MSYPLPSKDSSHRADRLPSIRKMKEAFREEQDDKAAKDIMDQLNVMFGESHALEWIFTPRMEFDGKAPIETDLGKVAKTVERLAKVGSPL